jgi:hypothetical protein
MRFIIRESVSAAAEPVRRCLRFPLKPSSRTGVAGRRSGSPSDNGLPLDADSTSIDPRRRSSTGRPHPGWEFESSGAPSRSGPGGPQVLLPRAGLNAVGNGEGARARVQGSRPGWESPHEALAGRLEGGKLDRIGMDGLEERAGPDGYTVGIGVAARILHPSRFCREGQEGKPEDARAAASPLRRPGRRPAGHPLAPSRPRELR